MEKEMPYVLITMTWFSYVGNYFIVMHDFNNKESCKAAVAQIAEGSKDVTFYHTKSYCVPK